MRRLLIAAAVIALAAACAKKAEAPQAPASAPEPAASEPAEPAPDATPDTMTEAAAPGEPMMSDATDAAPCPVSDSRNWQAWTTTDDAGTTLHVRGEVDLPTPGYQVSMTMGPADRAMPPGQRINLVAAAPDGIVTQVITPTAVSLDAPGAYENYRTVMIGCGGRSLAEIAPVGPKTE